MSVKTHRLQYGKKMVGLALDDSGRGFIALGSVASIIPSFCWDPVEPPCELVYFEPFGQAYIPLDKLSQAVGAGRTQWEAGAGLHQWALAALAALQAKKEG